MPEETALPAVETSASVETVETPAIETPAVETPTSETPDVEQAEAAVDPNDAAIDPSPIAPAIKKAIDALKATDPAAARTLRDLYHQQQAFKQEFPGGLKEVQSLKATLEQVGGAEGLQSLTTEKQEWDGIDEKFAAGDASVLDTFVANNPEGFLKLAPAVLTKMHQMDADAYNHTMSSVFVGTLDNMQFMPSLRSLAQSLSQIQDAQGNKLCTEELKTLNALAEQYNGLKDLSSKAPVKKIDPERQKLEEERKAFQQEKVAAVHSEVNAATQEYAQGKYAELLKAESAAGIKLPEAGTRSYQKMLAELDEEIGKEIGKDKATLSRLNALFATGKKQDLVTFMNAQFDKVAAKVVQRVAKEWTSTKNPVAKPAQKAATADAGGLKLKQAPQQDQVDWTKTTRADVMNGRAYLKGRTGLHTWM